MEIRVLKYFLSVAREENITSAAKQLHISQPTLSKQLIDLEKELGVKLFERGKRKTTLTEDGMYLRQRAQEIVDLAEKTETALQSNKTTIKGDVYIGCGETQGMREIIKIMKKINANYPDIHFHLYSGNDEDVSERLDKGLVDFGLFVGNTNLDRYNYFKLPSYDTWGLLVRSDDSLANKKTISPHDLENLPIICPRQALNRNELSNWLGNEFNKLNIISTYNLLYNVSLMVEEKIGYAVSLSNLHEVTNENLIFRPFDPQINAELYFAWKKYHIFSKAAKLFLNYCNKVF